MSNFGKKVSDKLDDAAVVMHLTGEKLGGKVGSTVATVLAATLLGRYWEPCSDTCECNHEPS